MLDTNQAPPDLVDFAMRYAPNVGSALAILGRRGWRARETCFFLMNLNEPSGRVLHAALGGEPQEVMGASDGAVLIPKRYGAARRFFRERRELSGHGLDRALAHPPAPGLVRVFAFLAGEALLTTVPVDPRKAGAEAEP